MFKPLDALFKVYIMDFCRYFHIEKARQLSSDVTPEYALVRLHPDAAAIMREIAKKRCNGNEDDAVTQALICFQTIIQEVEAGNTLAIVFPDGRARELELLP